LGSPTATGGVAQCGQRCLADPKCTGFQARSFQDCSGLGAGTDTCRLWSSRECVPEQNECWDQYEISRSLLVEGSCQSYGCAEYSADQVCQCNMQCVLDDSCCPDYSEVCQARALFDARRSPERVRLKPGVHP
jgi:hypothetical protein